LLKLIAAEATKHVDAERAIFILDRTRARPFVAVNCAALPEPLVESERFGIEKGVATGVERRVG
jgi:transcriptional regulator with GAF, ATPase, and Fis domain